MTAMDIGRICIKTRGREAGRRCVVVDLVDKNFVLITGPKELTGVKRRRANVNHLSPTEERIEIKRGASDEEIMKILGKAKAKRKAKAEAAGEEKPSEEKPRERKARPKRAAKDQKDQAAPSA